MLNLITCVYIDYQTGLVKPARIVRTHTKAVEMKVQKFFTLLDEAKPPHFAALNGNAPEEAEHFSWSILPVLF
jgi:hypothetical protein